jgi:hypothetical protein
MLTDKLLDFLEPVAKFASTIQREISAGLGKFSVTSTGSAGNMSARSTSAADTTMLDVTMTINQDLKDIMCPSLICVMRDYQQSDEDSMLISKRKEARKILESCFKPNNGVTSDSMRKNKVIECFNNIFSHKDCFAMKRPAAEDVSRDQIPSTDLDEEFKRDAARFVRSIKKSVQAKAICGKVLNGKMLLGLALEYAETLSS